VRGQTQKSGIVISKCVFSLSVPLHPLRLNPLPGRFGCGRRPRWAHPPHPRSISFGLERSPRREIRGSFSRIVLRLLRCIAANSSFVPPLPATPGRRARYPLSTLHHPSASVAPFCTFLHFFAPYRARLSASWAPRCCLTRAARVISISTSPPAHITAGATPEPSKKTARAATPPVPSSLPHPILPPAGLRNELHDNRRER
jgi:hypothetical protein